MPSSSATCLLDVLGCLNLEAADSLVQGLQAEVGCLAAARLSCRALRAFVDKGPVNLQLTIQPGDLPSLRQWPRVRSLALQVDGGESSFEQEDGSEVVLLALRPFMKPPVCQQLQSLTLSSSPRLRATAGEALVSLVVQRLPSLRSLEFLMKGCMSYDPVHLRRMYTALAAMPHLERLTLPGCRSLTRAVGELAACASLRRLSILETYDGELTAAAVAGLSLLQQLQELSLPDAAGTLYFGGGGARIGLRALLGSRLPPALKLLTVGRSRRSRAHEPIFRITLEGGLFSEVWVNGWEEELELGHLKELAELLLGCAAMGPDLERFDMDDEVMVSPAECKLKGQLRELLLRRCVHVRVQCVQTLTLPDMKDAPAADLLQLLPALGPDELRIGFSTGHDEFALELATDGPDLRDDQSRDEERGQQPAAPAALFRAALRCMAYLGGPNSQEGAGGGTASSGAAGGGSSLGGRSLLLQGSFVAAMGDAQGGLGSWVRHLAGQAAATSRPDWGRTPVLSYQAVPPASAVLLTCASAAAAAAVASAAKAAVGGEAAAAGQLEAVPLRGHTATTCELFCALEEILNDYWYFSALEGESGSQRQRLECVLAVRDLFHQLPHAGYL